MGYIKGNKRPPISDAVWAAQEKRIKENTELNEKEKDTALDLLSREVALRQVIAPTPDPWLREVRFKQSNSRYPHVRLNAKLSTPQYVSLGKVLSIFVIEPLAMTGEYDEIQVMFYTFNSESSYMHDFNIAQFPIRVTNLEAALNKLTAITANIPLTEFMDFLNNNFVHSYNCAAYGFGRTFDKFGDDKRIKSLKDEAKLAIRHISQLDAEINALQMKLIQLNAAKSVFLGQLKSALPET